MALEHGFASEDQQNDDHECDPLMSAVAGGSVLIA